MKRKHKTIMSICQECGKGFDCKKLSALYCSTACRTRAFRARKAGDGRTWNDVNELAKQKANQLSSIAPASYKAIEQVLETQGARMATIIINAAYSAFWDGARAYEQSNDLAHNQAFAEWYGVSQSEYQTEMFKESVGA